MNSEKSKKWVYAYWMILAAAITAEHLLIYPIWQRRELARRTLGISTVMGLAWPLSEAGVLDKRTWETIFYGFGIAGLVTSLLHIGRDVLEARKIRGELQNGGDAWEEAWKDWDRRIEIPD